MPLATLLLILGANATTNQVAPPVEAKQVEAAVAELDGVFKPGKSSDDRIAAIQKSCTIVDSRVATAIERGLREKDTEVRAAAVDALGRMPISTALEALHKFYKGEKSRLKEDVFLLPLVFKAIGRHGSEKSIAFLDDDLFLQRWFPTIQARVLGLGNIRSKKSVEALMGMITKNSPEQLKAYMEVFRVSLVRLTGTDQGPDPTAWTKWWREAKPKLEVSKDPAKLPEFAERAWNEFWGVTPANVDPK